ncbi:MAG TPA: type II secretion system F family protein [Chroococcales cyanobacterium]|jgi:tight adherence protein B
MNAISSVPLWLFFLFFGGLTLSLFFLATALSPRTNRIGDRIDRLYTPDVVQVKSGGGGFADFGKSLNPMLSRFAFAARLEKKLVQSGMPVSSGEYIATSLVFGLSAFSLVFLFTRNILFAGLAFWGGAYLPWMQMEKKRRLFSTAINEQLPNSLMLITNALRAGNGFLQALQIVATQMPPPISIQFSHTIQDINWGLTVEAALVRLQQRVGTVDFELAISAILIQRETGGNLAEILTNIHDTIRDRIRMQGEVQALTAQGRLSGWVLSILPSGVGLLFYVLNPAYISLLFTDPRGQMVVGAAIFSQIIGIFAIRRIVTIKF